MDAKVALSITFASLLFLMLILIFDEQFFYVVHAVKIGIVSAITGQSPQSSKCNVIIVDDDDDGGFEHLNDPKVTVMNPPAEVTSTLTALGYDPSATPWDEALKASELDPSTFANHMDFVKDVRRFSSGANFTSVTDDNTNIDFTNFRGLRRPEHVPIGASARQVPDIDESVLQRNRPLRW
jgi:hypothetical protein